MRKLEENWKLVAKMTVFLSTFMEKALEKESSRAATEIFERALLAFDGQ
jgi:hypothetical protein